MRITAFGNNATCPEADGACASYLVEAAGKKILLDMGSGSIAKIRQELDLARLDLIVISHLHFDHFGDLFCAKYHLETRKAYGEKFPPIPLLIPKLPQWAKAELSGNHVFEIHPISDGDAFELENVHLEFVEMVHLIESYGIRITAEGKILAYSGDTGICDGLRTVAAGADAFLCEATFCGENRAEEKHHLSAGTAAKIAADAGIQQLFLTHYHSDQSENVLEEAQRFFADAKLTHIGQTFLINSDNSQQHAGLHGNQQGIML